jgi:hypothetical protein
LHYLNHKTSKVLNRVRRTICLASKIKWFEPQELLSFGARGGAIGLNGKFVPFFRSN